MCVVKDFHFRETCLKTNGYIVNFYYTDIQFWGEIVRKTEISA